MSNGTPRAPSHGTPHAPSPPTPTSDAAGPRPAAPAPASTSAPQPAGAPPPRRPRGALAPPPLPPPDPALVARARRRMRFFWEHLFGYFVLAGGALLSLLLIESRIPGELFSLELVHPWALLLLLAIPLLAYVGFHTAGRRRGALVFSRVPDLRAVGPGLGARLRKIPPALRILALALFAVALGRPQSHLTISHAEQVEGIDIVLALDVSRSMQARDLSGQIFGGKTRLDVAKEVIDEFIRRREHDRIGLVLFGREAYTWCPPTLDYQALRTLLSEVKLGIINGRATAIGDAVGTAINRLRHSKASSKVIILLTDGENNAGTITPNQAANYAATFKIKVFTILMGKNVGGGHRGLLGRRGARVNPRLLEQIATITGGTPYLATDRQALRERFQRILDTLKKDVRVRKERRPSEHWRLFAVSGLLLLLLELFLRLAVLRRFP